MIETLSSLSFPLTVLFVAGVLILGAGWWATLEAEQHDDWIFGDPDAGLPALPFHNRQVNR